jgi:hypothetical protein
MAKLRLVQDPTNDVRGRRHPKQFAVGMEVSLALGTSGPIPVLVFLGSPRVFDELAIRVKKYTIASAYLVDLVHKQLQ